MSRWSRSTILILPLLALTVPGCGFGIHLGDPPIQGSGSPTSESREVSEFQRVEISGAFDVEIEVGPEIGVRVEGDDNLVPHVRIRVDERTLEIEPDTDRDLRPRAGLRVFVSAAHLEGLASGGSSDVIVRGIDADAFDLHVSGSSDVVAGGRFGHLTATVSGSGEIRGEGRAESIDGHVSGSGELDLRNVPARVAVVQVSGSGEIHLDVSERLDANVSGSGEVVYRGDARVRSTVEGSGSVHRGG